MRIELTKGKNNEWYIPIKRYARNELRIMKVDIGRVLKDDEYHMMGPRKIHIDIDISPNIRVYATVMDIKKGNRMIMK